jgi:hypothetical protein
LIDEPARGRCGSATMLTRRRLTNASMRLLQNKADDSAAQTSEAACPPDTLSTQNTIARWDLHHEPATRWRQAGQVAVPSVRPLPNCGFQFLRGFVRNPAQVGSSSRVHDGWAAPGAGGQNASATRMVVELGPGTGETSAFLRATVLPRRCWPSRLDTVHHRLHASFDPRFSLG